mmetsp:Transcript_5872/g.14921  ORF Transcript_5872/g.14921 Transcript_5872/m.14921 type:complete len:440 (-) Transcript_5872:895-2214(-)
MKLHRVPARHDGALLRLIPGALAPHAHGAPAPHAHQELDGARVLRLLLGRQHHLQRDGLRPAGAAPALDGAAGRRDGEGAEAAAGVVQLVGHAPLRVRLAVVSEHQAPRARLGGVDVHQPELHLLRGDRDIRVDVLTHQGERLHVLVVVLHHQRAVRDVVVPLHPPVLVLVRLRRVELHRHVQVLARRHHERDVVHLAPGEGRPAQCAGPLQPQLRHAALHLHDGKRLLGAQLERHRRVPDVGERHRAVVRAVQHVHRRVAHPREVRRRVRLQPRAEGVRGQAHDERLHGLGGRRGGGMERAIDADPHGVGGGGGGGDIARLAPSHPRLGRRAPQLQRQLLLVASNAGEPMCAAHVPHERPRGVAPVIRVHHRESLASTVRGDDHLPRRLHLERAGLRAHDAAPDHHHRHQPGSLVHRELGRRVAREAAACTARHLIAV